MFSEINLPKLKACARAWAARNPLIFKIMLYKGFDYPYVLVIQAIHPESLKVQNSVTGKSEHKPDPDYLRLKDDWADPECFEVQDDLLEVSQNDFDCSAKISIFFGKWQSHLLFKGEKPPANLVYVDSEVTLFE
jgi:hypothetical protein